MRRMLFALCLTLLIGAAQPASADMLNISDLNSLVYGTTKYGGEYVGPLGATLGSSTITGGITCLDINTHTNVLSSFAVYVGSLDHPVDLTQAKFASDPYTPEQLSNYQKAAALLGQMPSHADEIGPIQFAIWRIFDPGHTPGDNPGREAYWLDWASHINVSDYGFSSVRIYTATDTNNQEFMSGAASHVPVPASVFLLGSGLLGLSLVGWRRKTGLKLYPEKPRSW
jgi:hypothetical protein